MRKKTNDILRRAFIDADVEYFELITKQTTIEWKPSERFERKMEILLHKYGHHPHKSWTTNWKKAACAAFIVVILTSSILSVEAIRRPVVDFFTKIYEKFSSVFILENDDLNAPDSIETEYLPTDIPSGYKVKSQNKDVTYKQIVYTDENNFEIIFVQQILSESHFILDTEGVEMHAISVGNQNGQYYINKGFVSLSWTAHDYLFFLSIPEHYTVADAVKIAESLEQIE